MVNHSGNQEHSSEPDETPPAAFAQTRSQIEALVGPIPADVWEDFVSYLSLSLSMGTELDSAVADALCLCEPLQAWAKRARRPWYTRPALAGAALVIVVSGTWFAGWSGASDQDGTGRQDGAQMKDAGEVTAAAPADPDAIEFHEDQLYRRDIEGLLFLRDQSLGGDPSGAWHYAAGRYLIDFEGVIIDEETRNLNSRSKRWLNIVQRSGHPRSVKWIAAWLDHPSLAMRMSASVNLIMIDGQGELEVPRNLLERARAIRAQGSRAPDDQR